MFLSFSNPSWQSIPKFESKLLGIIQEDDKIITLTKHEKRLGFAGKNVSLFRIVVTQYEIVLFAYSF